LRGEFADRFGAGRVHGGQGDGDAGGRLGRGDQGVGDLGRLQGKDHTVGLLADTDPDRGVAEDGAVLLGSSLHRVGHEG